MKLFLKVWKQDGPQDEGRFESHVLEGVSEDSSFLEMLDQLNEQLLDEGKEPVAFVAPVPNSELVKVGPVLPDDLPRLAQPCAAGIVVIGRTEEGDIGFKKRPLGQRARQGCPGQPCSYNRGCPQMPQ